jgi:hypothetical protein
VVDSLNESSPLGLLDQVVRPIYTHGLLLGVSLAQRCRRAAMLQRRSPSPQSPANSTLVLILGKQKWTNAPLAFTCCRTEESRVMEPERKGRKYRSRVNRRRP